MLGSGLICIDFFGVEDTPSHLGSLLRQRDPVQLHVLWRSACSSRFNCWHSDESEHLGSSDTRGPFLAHHTQAQMHKLVHSAETTRDRAIGLVE